MRERAKRHWDAHLVSSLYNQAEGNLRSFRKLVRSHYQQPSYGLDPATIMMLLQMAIQLYFWAKRNNFLSIIPATAYGSIPSFEILSSVSLSDEDYQQVEALGSDE